MSGVLKAWKSVYCVLSDHKVVCRVLNDWDSVHRVLNDWYSVHRVLGQSSDLGRVVSPGVLSNLECFSGLATSVSATSPPSKNNNNNNKNNNNNNKKTKNKKLHTPVLSRTTMLTLLESFAFCAFLLSQYRKTTHNSQSRTRRIIIYLLVCFVSSG